jgi:4-amino-4-deoxychorismate lyase
MMNLRNLSTRFMCQLFETIRICNGQLIYPEWHEARMKLSLQEISDFHGPLILREIVKVPDEWKTGLVQCNVTYGNEMKSVTYKPYIKRQVKSLKLIECNDIDYHLKRSDRSLLDELFSRKGDRDEIIIIKNGFITDTSISNLIFFDGKNWFTPKMHLLNGTCRQRLLKERKISEMEIRVEDFWHFPGLKLINAMRFPEEETIIPTNAVSM